MVLQFWVIQYCIHVFMSSESPTISILMQSLIYLVDSVAISDGAEDIVLETFTDESDPADALWAALFPGSHLIK